MAINTSPEENPAGSSSPTAGCQNKAFSTLRAAFSLQGHALHHTDPADGPVTYWVERWGQVRHLATVGAVQRFLEQIGGQL